jgi:hypothetical protein
MEQNNKLTPAFINEKDVCTDFIYDMFDGCGEFIEHIGKNQYHIVGYWEERLIEVFWQCCSNIITFAFVDLMENHHTGKDEEKLIDFIKDVDSENTGLVVEVYRYSNLIISDWYFKE